jgi:putative tricarboxylic transport membrane protein
MTGFRAGEAILGAVALVLAGTIAWGTWTAPAIAARTVVGPGAFPSLIAAGLLLVGLRLLWEAWSQATPALAIPPLDWPAMLMVAGSLLLAALVLPQLGWVLTAALLFVAVARGFGSRRWALGAAIGLALGGLTFVVFDALLGLSLPVGAWTEAALVGAGLID